MFPLKLSFTGVLSGALAAVVWHHFAGHKPAAQPTESDQTQPTQKSFEVEIRDDEWLKNNAPLPPPFSPSPSAPKDRRTLSAEERAKIVFDQRELLEADDYLGVLESLADTSPELLYQQALNHHSLAGVVAMRCFLARNKDFGQAVSKLADLVTDPFWNSKIVDLADELWTRPEAEMGNQLLALLADPRLPTDPMGKFQFLFEKRIEKDFEGTMEFLKAHPTKIDVSGVVNQKWAQQNPRSAADWIQSNLPAKAEDRAMSYIRQIGLGIASTGNLEETKRVMTAINQRSAEPAFVSLKAELLRKAAEKSRPEDWLDEVRQMPPGLWKDNVALEFAIQLDKAKRIPPDWTAWFNDLGTSNAQDMVVGIELAKKRGF